MQASSEIQNTTSVFSGVKLNLQLLVLNSITMFCIGALLSDKLELYSAYHIITLGWRIALQLASL